MRNDPPESGELEILTPRLVPLGGLRAMPVRRTLPQRQRSLIGAWCFADHYGPDRVATTGGMVVPPHPHTGLQTVSWLFRGEIEHRDSTGSHALVRPGEVNLMTAGRGIAHSEVSTPDTAVLHGAQLWVALPAAARDTEPGFEHYAPAPVELPGGSALVFLGALAGRTSPVRTFTPLLGAELRVHAGGVLELAVDPAFEHGLLADTAAVLDGHLLAPGELAYLPPGHRRIRVAAGAEPARLLLLGGEPFGEQIVMWWNFIGRTHEDIVGYRRQWQAELAGTADTLRFGVVPDYPTDWIPAPPLPTVRLRSRG
ncbi:pirin family protein [Skermania piniformis]|uniref:Pirin family protein n=1 Tax=Skermania pinensis TaxID=39122 RepID=A0ABX8S9Q3_9ACTN|nr:pirin family protein [Skermania piniformis]QXQ13714.1 pirin family protein [Skermania piniformis]